MGDQQSYWVGIYTPPSNGFAVTSGILGMTALAIGVWSVLPAVGLFAALGGYILAMVAVVLGHLGIARAWQTNETGRASARVGLLTGYAALVIVVLATAFWSLYFDISGAGTATGGP